MNYLGHAFLSYGDNEILTGNMIGDHVKGLLVQIDFPLKIWKGVMLHRKIDDFVDRHPATGRAKLFFRTDYGLYSGAIMDTIYDHFLANDPRFFADDEALKRFSKGVYAGISLNGKYLPEGFSAYFPHMVEHDWLAGYRSVKGIERALKGLHRRARHMPPPEKAYELFIAHYYQLNQCYFELIDDLVVFVKNELNN